MIKAIGLFSGGLDSNIAAKLIQNQGIDVELLIFKSPFFNYKKDCFAVKSAETNKIPFRLIDLGLDYLKIIERPRHGFGKFLNPCIDCKIFMLKKAKQYMKSSKADFVFTGEVLDQRPKSQHREALGIIAKGSGLKERLLRPLSAKLLKPTYPEIKGLVDRSKLLDLQGRQRKAQFQLAKELNIKDFSTPSGGCLLTEQSYCKKLSDLLKNKKNPKLNDLFLLKIGRHFRTNKNKIIVGKNQEDNTQIIKLKSNKDIIFEAKDYVGPTTLLQGPKTRPAIELAASLTARYSDAPDEKVMIIIKYGKKTLNISINKIKDIELQKYIIK